MNIIKNMLEKWVTIPENILEITNQKIIEVDAFEPMNQSTHLVIGYVKTCKKHPNADTLSLTTVDVNDEILEIVCGASNVRAGQTVIVAKPGAVLPGGLVIKPTKIRGVESNGMICSLKELGIQGSFIPEEFQEGIYYFDKPLEIGSDALCAIAQDGWVMTLGLTPNRADLLSVLGFAYDLASMTGQTVNLPSYPINEINEKNPYQVKIDTEGCGRYYLRAFKNVTIKPSPWWIQSALLASNIQPINNVVDISNYVMLEYGTPLHMFDEAKIKTQSIVIRDAIPGEKVITLDDEKRILESEDIVITDGNKAIAVGGVMGLKDSMIDENTTDVLLEAAYFEPKRILKTSKRLGLRSDSSVRFERGIDEERVILGLNRATELLIELADAEVLSDVATAIHHVKTNPVITVKTSYFKDALGMDVSLEMLCSIFDRYRYTYTLHEDSLSLQAPSDRRDIVIDADLLEEVARMIGLDSIPMKHVSRPMTGSLTLKQHQIRSIRHQLANQGFQEIVSYSLMNEEEATRYQRLGEPMSLTMPLSEDKKTMRQSLLSGLLEAIRYNQARQTMDLALFELGNCYAKGIETPYLGLAITGNYLINPWQKWSLKADFYLLKGLLDQLFISLGITLTYQIKENGQRFHPYRYAEILNGSTVIGFIAQLHPKEEARLDITKTWVAHVDLSALLGKPSTVSYEPVSKFPNVERDLAVVLDESIQSQTIMDLIKQTVKKSLVSMDVFDIYQGAPIEKGKKSIAFRLVFNDSEKTLNSDDVDKMMAKIINRLVFTYQAEVRK